MYIDPGDMILIHGGTLHKFFKPLGSVTLATNLISPFDLIRIMNLTDEWTIQSHDMRTKKAHGTMYQRLVADGIAKCGREEWFSRFDHGLFLGDHVLRAALPLVVRAYADGIMPHVSLKVALHARHDQAVALDEADKDMNTGGSWVATLTELVGGIKLDPMRYNCNKTRHEATRDWSWLIKRQYWERGWRAEVINARIETANDIKMKSIGKQSDEFAAVAPTLAMRDGVPDFINPNSPATQAIQDKLTEKMDEKLYQNRCEQHGLHESRSLRIPFNESWHDTNPKFLLAGGYVRYCLYTNKEGGQYAYSGKFCEPKPCAVKMKELPTFNLSFHRETWCTSSANLFVGWHQETIDRLQHERNLHLTKA